MNNEEGKKALVGEILDELMGLGPSRTAAQGPDRLRHPLQYLPRTSTSSVSGCWKRPTVRFIDDRHMMNIIDRIISRVGRRIDESTPDGRCPAPRRLPRQCHHPAAGRRRTDPLHPPLCRQPAENGRSDQLQIHHPGDRGIFGRMRYRPSST